jgi:hypothetical protein
MTLIWTRVTEMRVTDKRQKNVYPGGQDENRKTLNGYQIRHLSIRQYREQKGQYAEKKGLQFGPQDTERINSRNRQLIDRRNQVSSG